MPKVFTEWTVLPHRPIEKLADNLWRVSGKMGEIQRQMVLARMADGRVVVDNAIALDDAEMAEIEAWGEPRVLIVPNGYHRQDAVIWKQRYPRSTVVAPPRGRKRIEKLMPVDLLIGEAPADDTVRIVPMDGCASDTLLEVRSGDAITLVFCDADRPAGSRPRGSSAGSACRTSARSPRTWSASPRRPTSRASCSAMARP